VEQARKRGLFLRATGRPIGGRYWDGDRERASAQVREWLAQAHAIGSDSLMLYSGVYRPELAGDPAKIAAELQHLGAVLAGAQETARELGVALLLENASDFTTDELLSLLQEAANDAVGLFLDVTNVYNVWDDPLDAIARLGSYARAGHVKDFVLESNWAESGYHRHGYSVHFKYPGEGVTPVDALVRALAEVVGERDFCLAIEGLDSYAGVDDQVARLRPSFELLRGLIKTVSHNATQ
jgi:sugar phosphate isomerase/epimerase